MLRGKVKEKTTRKAKEKGKDYKGKSAGKATESPVRDCLPETGREKAKMEVATTVALQNTGYGIVLILVESTLQNTGYGIVLTLVESTVSARTSATMSSTRIMTTPMTTRTTRGTRRTTKASWDWPTEWATDDWDANVNYVGDQKYQTHSWTTRSWEPLPNTVFTAPCRPCCRFFVLPDYCFAVSVGSYHRRGSSHRWRDLHY